MNTNPLTLHQNMTAEIIPALRYTGQEDFSAWQKKCTDQLEKLLGMHTFSSCDPDLTVTEDVVENGMRRIHFLVQTELGYYCHCDFLLPALAEKPLPLCVCLQGHSKGAHISLGIAKYPGDAETIVEGDRDFAIRAVREGFCALAIEQRAFGQNGGTEDGPACIRPSVTALLLGRTTIGERVWDVSRVLDAVEEKFADIASMEGSVCMGNSGGGTATYYTACLEHRFAAYMPSCAVCTFKDSIVAVPHCSCNYVPGILQYFDMGDLAAMIAPKKLVVVCGKDDPIFPVYGVEESYQQMRACYAAAGVPDNCALVIGDGEHRFYADASWPVMKKMLNG